MAADPSGPKDGRRLLAGRLASLPARLRETARAPRTPLDLAPGTIRTFVTTGVGSSAAHARFLAHQLASAGLAARFEPLSAFTEEMRGQPSHALVVFSQGLSPNARIALTDPGKWGRVILATAARRGLDAIEDSGIVVRRFEEEDERGTLIRIVGPLCGYWTAHMLGRDIAARFDRPPLPDIEVEIVCERIEAATREAVERVPDLAWLDEEIAFLVSGSYGELVGNLPLKILEGWLRPLPAVHDLLAIAHGPFQELLGKRCTFLALTQAGARAEPELLDRVRAMLDPVGHRMVLLPAILPAPFAIFEHEAMLDAICLPVIEARGIDPGDWPGRDGGDQPIYGIDRSPRPAPSRSQHLARDRPAHRQRPPNRRAPARSHRAARAAPPALGRHDDCRRARGALLRRGR